MWSTILYRTLQKLTCSKPINDTVPVHCQDGEQSFANTPRPNCDDISIMCLIGIVPYIFKQDARVHKLRHISRARDNRWKVEVRGEAH